MITANRAFGAWENIFPDKAMTIATIDRLVHHATIFEMNVESFRRRTAIQQRQLATSNLEVSDIVSAEQNNDV